MGPTRMSGADAAWLQMDRPTNPMVVHVLVTVAGDLDPGAVATTLAARAVPTFPQLTMLAATPPLLVRAIAPVRWVPDPAFDPARHVHHASIDPPGDDAALHRLVASLAGTHLPTDRPLWEAHVVDGYTHGGAVLLRTHHAIGDGTALMRLLTAVTDGPDQDLGGSGRSAAGPLDLDLERARYDGAVLEKLARPTERAPLSGDLDGAKTVARSRLLPLADLKAVGRSCGGTVNDVLLAAVAGGFRRYLHRHAGECPSTEVVVPVDLRGDDEPPDALGNRFGLVFVRLPVEVGDARARLAAVKVEMDAIKRTRESTFVSGVLSALGHTVPAAEQHWVDLFARRASAVVTNIRGPAGPRTLAGRSVTGITLWVPSTGPIGIGVSFLSFDGAVSIGVVADTGVVADADELLGDVTDELEVLGATG